MEKIQKRIANSGYTSRRKAEELIKKKQVKVNGNIASVGMLVKKGDEIVINGKPLDEEPIVCFFLNKPRGYISSTKDEKGRKTVVDLIDTPYRIYPVGRLDYNTTGALFLTNDGELTDLLAHPSNNIGKVYLAKLDKVFLMKDFHILKKGLKIDGRILKVRNLKVKKKDYKKNTSYVQLEIVEGRNHIVKKAFSVLGYDVLKLTRLSYGPYNIHGLKSGEYYILTKAEIRELKESIKSNL